MTYLENLIITTYNINSIEQVAHRHDRYSRNKRGKYHMTSVVHYFIEHSRKSWRNHFIVIQLQQTLYLRLLAVLGYSK